MEFPFCFFRVRPSLSWLWILTVAAASCADQDLFSGSVWPLLQKNCLPCHNSAQKRSDLDLSTRATLLKGGMTGPAVVPGHPEDSLLYKLVTHQQSPEMPYRSPQLPAEAQDLLRQ